MEIRSRQQSVNNAISTNVGHFPYFDVVGLAGLSFCFELTQQTIGGVPTVRCGSRWTKVHGVTDTASYGGFIANVVGRLPDPFNKCAEPAQGEYHLSYFMTIDTNGCYASLATRR